MAGAIGCERDLPYMAPADQPINGYQLEGYVTDKLGIPVKGLKIALWYDFDYVDSDSTQSRQFVVDDSTKIARVVVLDMQHRLKRVLYQGKASLGALDYEFDMRDSTGLLLPTGIYTVSFTLGGVQRASFLDVIDGMVTAITDSLGHYIITNDFLPVGFYPAPIYAGDGYTFIGNYEVASDVALEFYLPTHRSVSVTLTQNQVTRLDYRI